VVTSAVPTRLDEPQRTVARPVRWRGIGLHTGVEAVARVLPAGPDTGYRLSRGADTIRLTPEAVCDTRRCTMLQVGEQTVSTVEHLLSALAALGIDNATIEVDGPEVPILDGSAALFVRDLLEAGLTTQDRPRRFLKLAESVWLTDGTSQMIATPADRFTVTACTDFGRPECAAGAHVESETVTPETFTTTIAPARTFGFRDEVDALLKAGLIRGGSLENALVLSPAGPSSPYCLPREPQRHKLLDLIGDLALVGRPLLAHVIAVRAGHRQHVALARELRRSVHAQD
jgi:UDP-3-O-acyl N-acetylglucosamine deacetylase